MCGIGGIVYRDRRLPEAAALARMSEAMRERGPDDSGDYRGPGIGLVHRRLSILDLSPAGRCPMGTDDGRIQVVHNGEIYNFLELKRELETRGHRFRSRCDSEVVLRGYAEWGTAVVDRLEGMFAFAIWDDSHERLVLARDRSGEKPLYYRDGAEDLAFSSTLIAMRSFCGDGLEVAPEAIECFLSHAFIPSSHTIWKGVHTLPPAHLAVFERKRGLRVERYWDLPRRESTSLSTRDAEERLEAALDRSVRARLIADVPVGGFLSGGIDSSLVMALAARHNHAIHSFSIGFEETDFSELPYARRVAESIGSTHHELILKDDDLLAIVPRLVWHYGQPFGDSSSIPTHLVSRFTRQAVKVALSGDGGDESFAGYWRAQANWYADRFRSILPERVRRRAVPALCFSAERAGLAGIAARLRALHELSLGPPGAAYTDALSWFNHRDAILGPELREALRGPGVRHDPVRCRTGHEWESDRCTPLQQLLYDDFQTLLPDDHLVKVDIASMAASLEVRTPFLDHNFVELAWSLPDSMKIRLGSRKWLLKRVAARHVPREVVYRRKAGFALPMVHWWRGRLAQVLSRLLVDSRCVERGWIERAAVERFLEEHRTGRAQHHVRLWLVLWLELWARVVIEMSMDRNTSLLEID
jgi:asparagine synthase (glutamine-hydrolysing)